MIISHYYTSLLEKILKDTINSNLKIKHFDDYISLCSNLESSIFKSVRDSIVKFFEQIDLVYKNSLDRKKLYCKGKYRKTLITIFGEISFERHYYTPKNGGESFFFVDKLLSGSHPAKHVYEAWHSHALGLLLLEDSFLKDWMPKTTT